jgi:NAD(P) transhydrogenase
MHPPMPEYDLVVIGSGPGGQKAAIAAAKLGKSVAVIEHDRMLGGVCTNTGTIPSKTLREAVVYLTGMTQRELYRSSYRVKENITPADLLARTQHVIDKEQDVVRSQLIRNRIELYTGHRGSGACPTCRKRSCLPPCLSPVQCHETRRVESA